MAVGRFRHIPLAAPLEPRLMLSASALEDQQLEAATPIELSALEQACVNGGIEPGEGGDLFRITGPARGKLALALLSTGGGLDPYLEVFNASGRRLRRNDNASRDSLDSALRVRVKAGQVLYVRARASCQTTGQYTLSITPLPRDDFGNSTASARLIRLRANGSRSRTGRVNYAEDTDVFEFVANRAGVLWARLQARGGSVLDGYLQLCDDQGNVLASNDDGPGSLNPEISFGVVEGRRYFLCASSVDGSVGRYRLSVRILPALPPAPGEPPSQQENLGETLPEDVTAGQEVLVKLVEADGRRELRILGTEAADRIDIQPDGAGLRVTSGGRSWTFDAIDSLRAYTFGGDDVVRLADGLDASAVVWTGEGDDDIYAAQTRRLEAHAGEGDDLLVSLNAAADRLEGGAGLDSFWADRDDVFADVSALEIHWGSVHRIGSFYQPYSPDPADPQYIPPRPGGQDLPDPLAEYSYADLSSLDLFNDGPQYADIAQGLLGDCYFLASLASLAQAAPRRIEQLIAPLGDGTYAVRFYRAGQEVYLRLDADLPRYNQYYLSYAQPSPTGEIWAPLLEKAYAFFRYGENSYASIEGGWMQDVMPQLTNLSASAIATRGASTGALFELIESSLQAGRAVTVGSYYHAAGPVVPGHAYMVQSVQRIGEECYVTLYNPWGVDGRAWDDRPGDGLIRLGIQQAKDSFSGVVVGVA
jgi:hypothetical protein